jgi:hypothetical protein
MNEPTLVNRPLATVLSERLSELESGALILVEDARPESAHFPVAGIWLGRKLKAHSRLLSSRKGRAGLAATVTLPFSELLRIQLTPLQTVDAIREECAGTLSRESRRASMTMRVSSVVIRTRSECPAMFSWLNAGTPWTPLTASEWV